MFYIQLYKFNFLGLFSGVLDFFLSGFVHQGFQSSVFFKFVLFLLTLFWFSGLMFPLFSPWARVGFLFFLTNFSWLGVRTFTLAFESFLVLFEGEHSWD